MNLKNTIIRGAIKAVVAGPATTPMNAAATRRTKNVACFQRFVSTSDCLSVGQGVVKGVVAPVKNSIAYLFMASCTVMTRLAIMRSS